MGDEAERLASRLLDRAREREQSAHLLGEDDDPELIRREVRRLARARGMRIRTGLVDGTLVVIRADAALWNESTAVMREKLRPTD